MAIYKATWDGDLLGFSGDPGTNDVIGDQDRLMKIEPGIEFVQYMRARRALHAGCFLHRLSDAVRA